MTFRPPALAVLLAAVIAASFLAGCGGDDPPEEVSQSELASRADAACTEAQRQFAEIQATPPAGAAGAAEQTEDLVGALEDELDELEGMTIAGAKRELYDRYVDAIARSRDLLEDGADAAGDQDSRGYGKLQSQLAAGKVERRSLAAKLGFKKCSPLG